MFDDNSANIFALQDSIVGEVARVLKVRLGSRVIDNLQNPRQLPNYLLAKRHDYTLNRGKGGVKTIVI